MDLTPEMRKIMMSVVDGDKQQFRDFLKNNKDNIH